MQPITINPNFLPLPTEGIQHVSVAERKEQLKTKVEEFASVLYSEMFQEMREAGKSDDDEQGSIFGGGDTNLFMHFVDEQMGRSFVKQGGNSLTEALYKQLSQRLESQSQQGGGR